MMLVSEAITGSIEHSAVSIILSMANKSKTSKAWMHEHVNDNFVHLAKQQGWRSRAIFKLQEIDQKDNLINTNQKNFCVVDLGAAPGSWSQYVAKKLDSQLLANSAKIIAVDLLEISPISGVNFIHGDFTDDKILQQIVDLIPTEDKNVNLVISVWLRTFPESQILTKHVPRICAIWR